jgi:mannosyltransferase OCH1-like enzyme
LDLVKTHFPFLLSIYISYPYEIYRCDMARVLYMYLYAGCYSDLDSVVLHPHTVSKLFSKTTADIIIGSAQDFGNGSGSVYSALGNCPNAFLFSKKRFQVFWLDCIEEMIRRRRFVLNASHNTGPGVLSHVLRKQYNGTSLDQGDYAVRYWDNRTEIEIGRIITKNQEKIDILHKHVIYPVEWWHSTKTLRKKYVYNYEDLKELYPRALMFHFWSGSWWWFAATG